MFGPRSESLAGTLEQMSWSSEGLGAGRRILERVRAVESMEAGEMEYKPKDQSLDFGH